MRTTRRLHSASRAAIIAAGLTLALTSCGGTSGAAAGADGANRGPGANGAASPGTAGGASATGAQGASGAPSDGKGAGAGTASPAKAGTGTGTGTGTGDDAYAYGHPCSARKLTVKVGSAQGLPATVRVITVTNNGSTACGLAYHPTIGFSAKGAALGITAVAPDGLGGAPAYPVRPGATAYAAVDLNPGGGSGPVADEINVLADAEHMPNADGTSLPLTAPGKVAAPKVGLYRTTARESLGTL
ncbi:DUF4232 domain-containing protein [Streptomyces sp. NPDC098789]|uniref:DUF4232 domain-containing protein n=1 Tax=Streptomyces sp. NPDC098789 TaxID=3366098 RepID=UPI0038191C5C